MDKVQIIRVEKRCIPMFGNKRHFPYGKLKVTDGVDTKIVNFCEYNGFCFKGKRYKLDYTGSMNFPKYEIVKEDI